MSLVYLAEHAENASFALELAEREAADTATPMLLDIVARMRDQSQQLGLNRDCSLERRVRRAHRFTPSGAHGAPYDFVDKWLMDISVEQTCG